MPIPSFVQKWEDIKIGVQKKTQGMKRLYMSHQSETIWRFLESRPIEYINREHENMLTKQK